MSELKLVLGTDEAEASGPAPDTSNPNPEPSKLNPMDALNRRDIELIKKSLAGMHKDGAELRNAIVTLHARNSQAPSRTFFIGLGVVGFLAIGTLAAARPMMDAASLRVPAVARVSPADTSR